MKTKTYPHVTGLYGDNGENPGALAVHAVLDPSPNYPEAGRIIVGSPATTPTIQGYMPNLGGFNGAPDAIERLAATLTEAVRDVREAMTGAPAGAAATKKLDLDDIERKARAEIEARANAPKSLAGEPLITTETAEAAWAHHRATEPKNVLALIAEFRRLGRIAKAATAFVDEQGKIATRELLERADFATSAWGYLVAAVPEDGR